MRLSDLKLILSEEPFQWFSKKRRTALLWVALRYLDLKEKRKLEKDVSL